jgi:hypothetical protein
MDEGNIAIEAPSVEEPRHGKRYGQAIERGFAIAERPS